MDVLMKQAAENDTEVPAAALEASPEDEGEEDEEEGGGWSSDDEGEVGGGLSLADAMSWQAKNKPAMEEGTVTMKSAKSYLAKGR